MDIEINNNKQQASFRNGKFYHTFTPSTANQTVKLYHMGCVGDTRLNRIQLEQGTEPTGFVEPKATTNTISGIFKNLRDLDVKMTDPDSDLWTRIKKTARGTVEEYHTNTIKNEIVKTAEGIVETLSKKVDGVTTSVATVSRTVDSINSNITSLEGNVLKKDEISITNNGIQLGSGKVVDGRTISSILTTQPENIKAITDKFIITPVNENLVKREYRDNFILDVRNGILNRIYGSNVDLIGEYYFKLSIIDFDPPSLYASIRVKYKDGTDGWFSSEFPTPDLANLETRTSVKVQVESGKEIEYIEPLVSQNKQSDFYRFVLKNLFVGKKKSAELIVDGTIEGKHIKSSTIETGHLQTGSVTSNIIAADAIKSKHLQVDDAMIEKIVSNKAFVTELWSQQAFINNLKTIKVTATSIDTEQLRGKTIQGVTIDASVITGETKIKIGEHGYMRPAGNGLRFCLPETNRANNGVGVQMLGNYGRGDSPYGLYVYIDPNFDTKEVAETESYLMTVNGYIRSKGIMNLRTQDVYFNIYNPKKDVHENTLTGVEIGYYNHPDIGLIFGHHGMIKDDKTVLSYRDIYYKYTPENGGVEYISLYYPLKASSSDIKLKTNITDSTYKGLDIISKLDFKSFEWIKGKELYHKKPTKIGLIAQDVQKIDEALVYMNGDYLALDEFRLLNIALKSIQELSTQNKELQQRIIKLEEK